MSTVESKKDKAKEPAYNKLLLVRAAYAKSNLLDPSGLSGLVADKPVAIRPSSASAGYHSESPPTHYGYVFKNLKRSDREKLTKFEEETEGTTLIPIENDLESALSLLGLQVCEL